MDAWWRQAIWPGKCAPLTPIYAARSRRMGPIYATNMDALLKASDVRFEYYDKERLPTTSWVQVQRLVDPGFLVEIEVVAELP
jgi:enamine deaminase RidA (YjgF/YER057c/UK114 family)